MNQWISEELGGSELGDKRLVKRLKIILGRMWQSPLASVTAACRGFAEVIAASRFFGNQQVTQEQVLAPHREATLLRVAQHQQVLYIQDTTELDFTAKKKLEGTGPLSNLERRGFFAHNELVISPERLPLGLWHTSIDARKDQEHGKAKDRKQKPIQEKESYRWLEGYRRGCELAALVPQSQVVVCADREADIYEIFAFHQSRLRSGQAAAHWLIRSNEDRCLKPPKKEQQTDEAQPLSRKIRQRLQQSPVLGSISFAVPAKEQTKKIKGSRSTRKSMRSKRVVTQQIRAIEVTLRPPWRKGFKLPPVTIRIVQAQELDAPPGEEPINWILLTDLECRDFDQARQVLELYLCRWEIEVFHKVLKTGCRVEELQFRTDVSIKLVILLYMIVAWRVLYVMHLGRECPELPCSVVFEEAEWHSSWVILKGGLPPPEPPSLNQMVRIVASFGGFLGRKSDGHPGPKTLWTGLCRVQDFAFCWLQTAHLRSSA
jgi:hypothetical protein